MQHTWSKHTGIQLHIDSKRFTEHCVRFANERSITPNVSGCQYVVFGQHVLKRLFTRIKEVTFIYNFNHGCSSVWVWLQAFVYGSKISELCDVSSVENRSLCAVEVG